MFIHYLQEWAFYMGKVVRRWMDILYDGWCFSSKRELTALYWYFFQKIAFDYNFQPLQQQASLFIPLSHITLSVPHRFTSP